MIRRPAESGKPAESYTVFYTGGTGRLEISGDSARLSMGKASEFVRSNIVSFEKTGDLSLNRVAVELKYFDMFGNSDVFGFAMHSNDFRAAKASLGK
ncbi:MAG: hypothetical protein V1787_06745 [Candidatus Micrarchaeota archaeon]